MKDLGWTHVAISVRNMAASIAFYERYAGMSVVHARTEPPEEQSNTAREPASPEARAGVVVAWLADAHRRLVLVLIERPDAKPALTGLAHLGIACQSREEVDALCAQAKQEGRAVVREPTDSGPPVGYWAFIADPDGNNFEVSYGQEIGLTLDRAAQDS